MSHFFTLRSISMCGVRNFSKSTIRNSTYNILNETEVLNKEDNLENILEKRNWKDPEIYKKINIGFAIPSLKRTETKHRIAHLKKNLSDPNLNKLSLKNKLKIPLDDVAKEWELNSAVKHIHAIADHYQIFDHLFGLAYFYPVVMLDIGYQYNDKTVPVHRGNLIFPSEANASPKVQFSSPPDSLWTLSLIGMDGHLEEPEGQYIHWLVTNIPGNDISKGNIICDYVQPMPLRGLGYQRYAFVLYKQDSTIQVDKIKNSCLRDRTFNNLEFYRKHQDNITPAGLSFFQSSWDSSTTKMFHDVYNITEPIFEYDFEPSHHKKQVWFPKGKPFNLYLDLYRDPKQIAKEYLVKKFKETDPFQPPQKPMKYPNLVPFDRNKPSWLNQKEKRDRMRWGRINEFLD